jgi:lipopolysaccharide export system permease protein
MNLTRSQFSRFLIPLALLAVGALLCLWLNPLEVRAVHQQLLGFPDSDVAAHQLRPWILGGLCFLPALAGFIYCLGGVLDRYLARQFFGIFFVCLGALAMIWLLMDLTDKIGDFRKSPHVFKTIAQFYGSRFPAVLLLLLPYSLLLALLYSLGKLSSTREVIAMIQSGRSVIRVTLPLLIAGLFFSLLSLGMNYHWAPIAEGTVDDILTEASGGVATEAPNVLYRDPAENRLWMIGAFPRNYQNGEPLLNVEVTTTRPDKTLESRLSAKRARWDRNTREWTFEDAVIGRFEADQPATYEVPSEPLVVNTWPETPWQLIKPGLSAAYLGIPDLNTWLEDNRRYHRFADAAPYLTQWHYRWALPCTCLITVLLSALMLLCASISTALGEAGKIHPMLAAWLPNLTFGLIGLYLFRRRITGQPIYLVLRRLMPSND